MARKVYVTVKVNLIIEMEDGIEVGDVISEMDYNFNSTIEGAEIVDTEIDEHEITDSK